MEAQLLSSIREINISLNQFYVILKCFSKHGVYSIRKIRKKIKNLLKDIIPHDFDRAYRVEFIQENRKELALKSLLKCKGEVPILRIHTFCYTIVISVVNIRISGKGGEKSVYMQVKLDYIYGS
ncbi:hypothetical protein AZ270_gp42 [Acidianus tailed spindle virus]|uniref:hypothetical protein n=1 Tax=Acidianus tailed spindle virus TaxID=1797140 RepID=UPI00076F2F5B|nr:hypothetical protein AZ270_gp42 [Acidianus tailed spindle virus]AME30065.1 hypothetical protein ATSV_F123 [Acidianus tailed spindle virus]